MRLDILIQEKLLYVTSVAIVFLARDLYCVCTIQLLGLGLGLLDHL